MSDRMWDDSDIDSEVEAMLYSQIHHQWIDEDEEMVPIDDVIREDIIELRNQAVEEIAVVTVSSEECEVLSDHAWLDSKYYTGLPAKRPRMDVTNGIERTEQKERKPRTTKRKKIVKRQNSSSSSTSGLEFFSSSDEEAAKNIYIHVDSKGKQPFKLPPIDSDDDEVITIISSSDDEKAKSPDSDSDVCEVDFIPAEERVKNWFIHPTDRPEVNKNLFRYHSRSMLSVQCSNCKHRGHLSKYCPDPKKEISCMTCGTEGHISRVCPKATCYRCWKGKHSHRYCRVNLMCTQCGLVGHLARQCPDTWRGYHSTLKPGPTRECVLRPSKEMYCYNCAKKGHYGHECKERRMLPELLPNRPFVTPVGPTNEPSASWAHDGGNANMQPAQNPVNREKKKFGQRPFPHWKKFNQGNLTKKKMKPNFPTKTNQVKERYYNNKNNNTNKFGQFHGRKWRRRPKTSNVNNSFS